MICLPGLKHCCLYFVQNHCEQYFEEINDRFVKLTRVHNEAFPASLTPVVHCTAFFSHKAKTNKLIDYSRKER
jgi:hypothetical protein